jgi:TolB-like protein
MACIFPGYEYDIFISYRQKDNKGDRWVSEFVDALRNELDATFKEEISVYFDINSRDGLLETHDVGASLKEKLKCLVFIPIVSQTYCDPKSYAWQNEFCAFNKLAKEDETGREIKLANGNVASRILPIKIHDLNSDDTALLESELGGPLRAIEFIFKSPGVNRPLTPSDNPAKNLNQILYKDQINKVANAIQEIIFGIKNKELLTSAHTSDESSLSQIMKLSFGKKLTKRSVLRAAIVYILTAVILWKVLVIGSGIINLTENTIRLIALFLSLLFPFAILMAWLFERSPKGFIRTGSVASLENTFTDEQKKPLTSNTFISLLLATIVALFVLFPKAVSDKPLSTGESEGKSIALLPFVDLSPDHDKEYFSEGMMEEILNHLYKIGDLKVTSRTSSMQYKGETKKSIKEIATELGVANILEGSVRLNKNKVRITVQLIRAATDEHLWSEDYDRDFSDIFSIQSEVAQEVAGALKARISPEALRIIDTKPTSSLEAYDLYLKANNLNIYIDKENEEAIALYKKAIEMDPNFSLSFSELGFRIFSGATYLSTSKGMDPMKSWQTAKTYLEKALKLNPDNGSAHTYMAWGLLWYEWDFAGAEKEYEKINLIYPNYSWTDYEVATGQFEQAYKGAIIGTETDSKNANVWQGVIISSYFAGHDPESVIRKVLTTPVMKDNIWVRAESARVYMYLKDYDQSVSIATQLVKDFPEVRSPRLSAIEAISYFKTNHTVESSLILGELQNKSEVTASGSSAFYTAMIYAVMGNKDLAFTWLEKAYRNHEVEMYWLKVEPPFESLRGDPRYQAMLDKVGFPK